MNKPFFRAALLGLGLTALLAVSAGAAYEGVGTVIDGPLNLRSEPSTASSVLARAARDEVVLVVEKAKEGWYEVDYGTVRGYMSADWLRVSDSCDAPLGRGRVETDGSSLNLRVAPGTDAPKVDSIPGGTVVALSGMKDGWFKVTYDGTEGYVSAEYILAVAGDDSREDAAAPAEKTAAVPAEDAELADRIVAYAKEFLGVPYVYGANGPNSFDCSGYTKYVYEHFGYDLTRAAASQLSDGTAVDPEDIQVGDLILWRKYGSSKAATHVGIYIGDDQYIHASSSGSVRINDMSYGSSVRYVVGVRRII